MFQIKVECIKRAISWRSHFFSRLTNKELFKHNFIFFTDNMYFLKRQSMEHKISYKKVLTHLFTFLHTDVANFCVCKNHFLSFFLNISGWNMEGI